MSRAPGSEYRFTLELGGIDDLTDDDLNRLFEAGCDDGSFGQTAGRWLADFHRRDDDFEAAVDRAIDQIESTLPHAYVRRLVVDDDDRVTAAEIARRVDLSREEVRLLANGERGGGDFPTPVGQIGRQRIWQWDEVRRWFAAHGRGSETEQEKHANAIRAINASLEMAALWKELSPRAKRLAAKHGPREVFAHA